MWVRRKQAVPVLEPHPRFGHMPDPPQPVKWELCEAIRWMRHGDHPIVRRIPHGHAHAHGVDPDLAGHMTTMLGSDSLVLSGEWLVRYPSGWVHHAVQQLPDIYEVAAL
jgi:hypothetical protein